MKIFLPCLALLLALSPVCPQYCKRALLSSYSLEGEVAFSEKQHPICTTIKKNCCTGEDTKKILGSYNNFLKPKLDDFNAKMDEAFKDLDNLHYVVSSVTMRTDLSGPQQVFCSTVQDQFKAFPFQKLMADLRLGFAVSSRLFRELHGTFFCAMCDFEAQQFMSLETRSVALDSGVCLNILASNRLFLAAQNINMIQYFQNVQNLLDCNQFTDLFNFPFLYGDRQKLATNFKNCYSNFDPDTMTPDCASVCQTLGTGTISSVFEGDFDFVSQAASYFINVIMNIKRTTGRKSFNPLRLMQRLNDQNEEVDFIQVPNKRIARMGPANTTNTTRNATTTTGTTTTGTPTTGATTTTTGTTTTPRPRLKKSRRMELESSAFDGLEKQGTLAVVWDKLAHPVRTLFGYKTQEEKLEELKKEGLQKLKPKLAPAKRSLISKWRVSSGIDKEISVISQSQKSILKKLRHAFRSSKNDRILSDEGHLRQDQTVPLPLFKSIFTPRLLAESSSDGAKSTKYYETLYDAMVYYSDQNSTEMNPRVTQPFDIGKFQINSVFGQGLNLGLYLGSMNWDITQDALARVLKGSTNLDDPDISLGFLLSVFTEQFGKALSADIAADFAIKVEADGLSPDDNALKTAKPPVYESWELFDSETLAKIIENEKEELEYPDPGPVSQFHTVFTTELMHKNGRRLKQAVNEAKMPKRNNWSRTWTPARRRRLNKVERFDSKADERLYQQRKRSEGYGHQKKRSAGRGRSLSDQTALDQVEGTFGVQPWLNV